MDLMGKLRAAATSHARTASRREVGHEIRAVRLGERWAAVARWPDSRSSQLPDASVRRLAVPAAVPFRPRSVELAQVLDLAAHRIAAQGTFAERRLLEAMSEVAVQSAPGVAAALMDPDGTEISRLRAFGLVHTHLLEALGPLEHARLLDLLDGGAGGLERPAGGGASAVTDRPMHGPRTRVCVEGCST